jgi:hypothetical protein
VTRVPLAVLALALASCVHERTKAYPVYGATPRREPASRSAPRAVVSSRAPVAEASRLPEPSAPPAPAPAFPAPAAAAPRPPRGDPARPAVPLAPRDVFLSSETEIAAGKATVHVPAALAAEAALTGGAVEDDGAGRRVATGGAVLRLRRLVVRAERLTVVVRPPGEDDFQVSARGGVSFRSEQPRSRLSETDLKSLLLTNDSFVPLR